MIARPEYRGSYPNRVMVGDILRHENAGWYYFVVATSNQYGNLTVDLCRYNGSTKKMDVICRNDTVDDRFTGSKNGIVPRIRQRAFRESGHDPSELTSEERLALHRRCNVCVR